MKTSIAQRASYRRRSDFRVIEDNGARFVIETRRYGLLALGAFFVAAGFGLSILAFSVASRNLPARLTLLFFSMVMALFGFAAAWASFTQRDTITIDHQRQRIVSKRASTRKRLGDPPFQVEEANLSELSFVELRVRGHRAALRFTFQSRGPIDIDYGTDAKQLESLGEKLASAVGSKLVRQLEPDA